MIVNTFLDSADLFLGQKHYSRFKAKETKPKIKTSLEALRVFYPCGKVLHKGSGVETHSLSSTK